jgi:hypothetical protein
MPYPSGSHPADPMTLDQLADMEKRLEPLVNERVLILPSTLLKLIRLARVGLMEPRERLVIDPHVLTPRGI